MRLLLPLVLLLAACAGETAVSTTALVEPPSMVTTSTSTTVLESTTTTEAEGPIDICPRGLVWEPGTTYSAECFVVPVAFEPLDDGWRSSGASGRWVSIRWVDPSDRGFATDVGIVPFESSEPPLTVLEEIAALQGLTLIGESVPVEVAGRSGLAVDFEGAPWQTGPEGEDPCNTVEPIRFAGDGNPIVGGVGPRSDSIGVGYCDIARIWVLEVNGLSVTIVGGADDPARHAEAVAKIEELFEGMSFEGVGS